MSEMLVPHGIMFHHFHNNNLHIKCQGSLSRDTLLELLEFYGRKHNILSADEFIDRLSKQKLLPNDVCLTFDDGLKCQYDVARDVLQENRLKAFWFIYTSPLEGEKEKLEIYHHFRFSMFNRVEDYYDAFFNISKEVGVDVDASLKAFNPDEYLVDSPFYTKEDKMFRYVRDCVLGQEKYYEIMDAMLAKYNYDIEGNAKNLWMNETEIKCLREEGHCIGIHSHTHPTRITEKGFDGQLFEYAHSKEVLERIIDGPVFAVSYPCGQYNEDTFNILDKIGMKIGFGAFYKAPKLGRSCYEIPRMDHSNILKELNK